MSEQQAICRTKGGTSFKERLYKEEEELREQIGELREEWQRFCECEAPLVRGYGDDEYCGLCQKRFIK